MLYFHLYLMHQLKEMLRHRFGQKSERYVGADNPQLSLYDDSAVDDDTTAPVADDNVVDIQSYKRRKKVGKGFANHLPRKEIIIPVAEKLRINPRCFQYRVKRKRHAFSATKVRNATQTLG